MSVGHGKSKVWPSTIHCFFKPSSLCIMLHLIQGAGIDKEKTSWTHPDRFNKQHAQIAQNNPLGWICTDYAYIYLVLAVHLEPPLPTNPTSREQPHFPSLITAMSPRWLPGFVFFWLVEAPAHVLSIITLRATLLGGHPCPKEWVISAGVISDHSDYRSD